MNKIKILSILVLMIIGIYIAAAVPGSITDLDNVTYEPTHINWTWKDPKDTNFSHVMVYIDGKFEDNVTKGIEFYGISNLAPSTNHKISTHTVDNKGRINLQWTNDSAKTAAIEDELDKKPPASVDKLKNVTYEPRHINWTWQDPKNIDFSHVMVYIDGKFEDNVTKGIEFYGISNLAPNTNYKIGTRTVDENGNVNKTWKNNTAKTAPLDTKPPKSITGLNNDSYAEDYIRWTWQDPNDADFSHVMVYIDGEFEDNFTKGIEFYNATGLDSGKEYTIGTRTVDDSGNVNKTWKNNTAKTANARPKIIIIKEPDNLNISVGTSLYFDVKIDQKVNITWKVNNDIVKSEDILVNKNSSYTFKPSTKGTYNIVVTAKNNNGTISKNWSVIVHSKTYSSGNRIWDGSKPDEYSLTYTWNPMSFSGFYYNVDNDIGNESITISLDSYADRNINEGDITYSTSPDEVSFDYADFGKYQVIGFMADKYFAGYTDNTKPPKPTESVKKISVIAQGQLHKVLMDDDQKRTLVVGSTITLKEGYVLKAKDVGDRTMLISLLKDGNEVDSASFLNAGDTYIYKKKVGSVSDLPIIMVKFDTVFMGKESQMAMLKGIFQISENYIEVDNGDKYGAMEITEANENKIAMENHNSVSLSEGSTIDLMGNLKIIVADNSSVVRFALFAEGTGYVRGTIYPATNEWTPMNFGLNVGKKNVGFYYDIDEDIGTEKLSIESMNGRSIPEGKLVYSTSPQEVSFNYDNFGSYSVIGFMADKYFAGYTDNSIVSDKKKVSTIGSGQLHKVLLDDDEKRVISVGSTLTLKEGYVLKAKEIDVGAGTGQMWMTLLKDGNEIDDEVVVTGESYVFKKKVGSVNELPTIAVHVDSVFRGREVNAAFIKGVFQIAEDYTKVGNGDDYGLMEITKTGNDEIVMKNKDSISLSSDSTINIMGNIKFKVASGGFRFYPFVTVTPDMIGNQLIIEAPSKATAGDMVKIRVTTGGDVVDVVDGVSISINPEVGMIEDKTDINGTVEYTLSKGLKGTYNITATKLGYEKATRNIDISQYIESRLSINMPTTVNQFETITILVTQNNTPVSNATIMYDNDSIGTTDNGGKYNHTLETSGVHTITALKTGYIQASRDIDVKVPFSEYKALDINITPGTVYAGNNIIIKSNITNVGTKGDSLPVALVFNDTEVDSKTVVLSPKEIKEINFTYTTVSNKGNYTVEILGQKKLLELKEKPLNIILIVGIITVVGAIIIFFLTREKGLDQLLTRFKKRE